MSPRTYYHPVADEVELYEAAYSVHADDLKGLQGVENPLC